MKKVCCIALIWISSTFSYAQLQDLYVLYVMGPYFEHFPQFNEDFAMYKSNNIQSITSISSIHEGVTIVGRPHTFKKQVRTLDYESNSIKISEFYIDDSVSYDSYVFEFNKKGLMSGCMRIFDDHSIYPDTNDYYLYGYAKNQMISNCQVIESSERGYSYCDSLKYEDNQLYERSDYSYNNEIDENGDTIRQYYKLKWLRFTYKGDTTFIDHFLLTDRQPYNRYVLVKGQLVFAARFSKGKPYWEKHYTYEFSHARPRLKTSRELRDGEVVARTTYSYEGDLLIQLETQYFHHYRYKFANEVVRFKYTYVN